MTTQNIHQREAKLLERVAELEQELETWKSVFPDIAPEQVQPDRSLLEARIAELETHIDQSNATIARYQSAYGELIE